MTAPSDAYSRIHDALDHSTAKGEGIPDGWYITDFLVIGTAESFHPDDAGMSMSFQVGPENDMPPHRILGLLEYTAARYRHLINQAEDD